MRGILNEVSDDEDPFKKEEDDLEDKYAEPPPVDPEIETKPLGADDIYPGSDIEGSKIGGTSMPHGLGYPNAPKKERKFDRKYIQDVVHINYIQGVSESDLDLQGKRDQVSMYNLIRTKFPWVFTVQHKKEYTKDEYHYPFAELFDNKNGGSNWLNSFSEKVRDERGNVVYWKAFPIDQLKAGAKNNRHWVMRYANMLRTLKAHPDFVEVMDTILEAIDHLYDFSVENPKNESNYPIYASLYDVTRRLGGAEEGGWWYNDEDPIQSIKVNNYKDAKKAVVQLLRMIPKADLNGKPYIILEKDEGHLGNKPPPSYS